MEGRLSWINPVEERDRTFTWVQTDRMRADRTQADRMRGLKDAVVIVTGGSEGIGYATAERLGQEGARVVICSRKQAKVDNAVNALKKQGIEVVGFAAHAAKADDIDRVIAGALERFGRIDHLFLNHAVSLFGYLVHDAFQTQEMTEEQFDKIINTNLKSFWMWSKRVKAHLHRGGSIVLNATLGAYYPGPPVPMYGISKTALVGMVKSLAAELGGLGIRVNCVAPGVIRTKMSKDSWEEKTKSQYMLGRIGEPSEVASVVAFLFSLDASYITGETIQVAGGAMIGSRL